MNDIKSFLSSKWLVIPFVLGSIVASVYLLQILLSFLSKFDWVFFTIIYAYIIYILIGPFNVLLQKIRIPSNISLYLAFLLFFTLLVVLIVFINPIVVEEFKDFSQKLSQINLNDTVNNFIIRFADIFNIDATQLKDTIIGRIQTFGEELASNIPLIAGNALVTFGQIVLALFLGYFFIRDGKKWFDYVLRMIPVNFRDEIQLISNSFNVSAASFFRVQVFMAMIYGVLNYIIMNILGLDFSLVASIIAFLTFIIPGVGPLLAMIVPVSIALLFDLNKAWLLLIIMFALQQVILNFIIPKVYGDKVGIHPMVIIFTIIISIQLFGVLGAFIAIPVISVIVNVAESYIKKHIDNVELKELNQN